MLVVGGRGFSIDCGVVLLLRLLATRIESLAQVDLHGLAWCILLLLLLILARMLNLICTLSHHTLDVEVSGINRRRS